MDRARLNALITEFLNWYETWDASRNDNVRRDVARQAESHLFTLYPLVVRVVERVAPAAVGTIESVEWDPNIPSWSSVQRAALAARGVINLGAEIDDALGPEETPGLEAGSFHPTVWGAAKTFWETSHRNEAVHTAAKAVNAHLQDKIRRRDVSEGDLIKEAFTTTPQTGKYSLNMPPHDATPTHRSRQLGALLFGQGVFSGIRNPLAHEFDPDSELPQSIALEYLACLSVLARWIDEAIVITGP